MTKRTTEQLIAQARKRLRQLDRLYDALRERGVEMVRADAKGYLRGAWVREEDTAFVRELGKPKDDGVMPF